MMTKNNKDRLANLLKKNANEIVANKYDWQDEEIELFYEYANEVCDCLKIRENREDLIQDMLVNIFPNALTRLDLDNYDDPLGYLFKAMRNVYIRKKIYNSRQKRSEEDTVIFSLNKIDKYPSNILTPQEIYFIDEVDKYKEKIKTIITQTPILKEHLIDGIQLNDMAQKYNVPCSTLAFKFYELFDKIKIMSAEDGFYESLFDLDKHKNGEIIDKITKYGVLGVNVLMGMSYKDIADVINVKERSIQKRVNNEKRKIKEVLRNNNIRVSALGVDLYIYIFQDSLKNFENISSNYLKDLETEIIKRKMEMFTKSINVSENLNKKQIERLKISIEGVKKDIRLKIKKDNSNTFRKKR